MKRLAIGSLLVVACNVTPLTNKIAVGEEAFVIGVGEGADSATDLWAVSAGGGSFARVTFSRAEERLPRLSPDGKRVAFVRRISGGPDRRWHLVLLDLVSNAERTAPVPAEAEEPRGLGWSADGSQIVLRATGYYVSPTPPGRVVLTEGSPADLPLLDSLTQVRVGPAGQGVVEPCGATLCVNVAGELTMLGDAVSSALRWGSDSVGYFDDGVFEVRPLAGGRARRPRWQAVPARLRELTHFPGVSSPR